MLWLTLIILVIILLLIIEKIQDDKNGLGLPNPGINIPYLGNLYLMINDPSGFWDFQDKLGDMSWNKIFGVIFYYCRKTELSREVLANSSNNKLEICLNLNGERLFGRDNINFMQGQEHKCLRNQLLPLLTKRALSKYLETQEIIIRNHIIKWIIYSDGMDKIEMREVLRELNLESSRSIFIGDYFSPEDEVKFGHDYNLINDAFLAFPINLPGTCLWKGIRAKKRMIKMLEECARKSRERKMKSDEAKSLLDHWMLNINNSYSNTQVAQTMLSILYASQDASTSSLTWVCYFLCKYPEYYKRIKEEQDGKKVELDEIRGMRFTNCFIKEVLRYRPAATLVPHKVLQDFELDGKIIPKGKMIIPSLFSSSFQGYKDPYKFNPERFNDEMDEGRKCAKNFLVFGSGPHKCLGYEYASLHLLVFTILFVRMCQFEKIETSESDKIVYGPTIFPGDGCLLKISAN